jgi:transglutaminase-like putative cysteine protease
MGPKYEVGQKVIIRPVKGQPLSLRESDIERYAGKIGEISNYYWVSPRTTEVFYIYTVRIETDFEREVVLYEDELEPCLI